MMNTIAHMGPTSDYVHLFVLIFGLPGLLVFFMIGGVSFLLERKKISGFGTRLYSIIVLIVAGIIEALMLFVFLICGIFGAFYALIISTAGYFALIRTIRLYRRS